jgi:hypothetical protein
MPFFKQKLWCFPSNFTVEFLKKNPFDFEGKIDLIGTVSCAGGTYGIDTFPRRLMRLQYCIRNVEQTPRTSSGKCYPLTVPFTTVNIQYTKSVHRCENQAMG